MSLAKSDKLGLLFPKELIWGCYCSLWTNPGKKAEQKQEPRRPQEKSAVSKLAKCSCKQVDTGIFTNKKKSREGDWQRKFVLDYSSYCSSTFFLLSSFRWCAIVSLNWISTKAEKESKVSVQWGKVIST